jgi:hypothetical protein
MARRKVFEGPVRYFQLRLPEEVAQRLERSAAANRRSMNAECVVAVEAWLAQGPAAPAPRRRKREAVPHGS